MCGIVTVWGRDDPALTERLLARLGHRGPDARGLASVGEGTLGHRRLAIMDPRGGDQPIRSEDGRSLIVTNGEIYNFPRLRAELARGHTFTTGSDSEAILHLYEEHGEAAVAELDGMFAFAVSDGSSLLAARDPVGIKPLYLGHLDGGIVLASELKAFAGLGAEVEEFPPGCTYTPESGFRRYRALPDLDVDQRPYEELVRKLRQTVEQAVTKRLMSDVPVGAFLSGGLDSSIIAAVARRHVDELHTFSVGLEGSPDLEAARRVAEHLGTVHHERCFTPEEAEARLPEVLFYLESYDQDLVRSAVPCDLVSELAARHVKVILTGEGADELFGGYAYHKAIRDEDRLHRELARSLSTLHNVNLQRVDRLTMAHSIEGRVPFLDLEVIELAQRIPPRWKILREGGEAVEKWILRRAFEDLLPAAIVWREKVQFDEGSGTARMLPAGLAGRLSEREASRYRAAHPEVALRSREECVYHRLLTEAFDDPSPVLTNVARWAERPADLAAAP